LQLVVFGNLKACAICNFTTYLDGNTMMRAGAEITRRGSQIPFTPGRNPALPALAPARQLSLPVPPLALERAWGQLQPVLDDQPATFVLPGFGRQYFAKNQVDPVPAFILALQAATQRFVPRPVRISQFLTMSKYRCLDLTQAMVSTPEVMRFVEIIQGKEQVAPPQARQALDQAIESQARECRIARRYFGVGEIYGLLLKERGPVLGTLTHFISIGMAFALRLLGRWKPHPTEVIVSHPEIYPEVPVVGRPGVRLPYARYYGLHYQIWDDRIVITFMPGVGWKTSNSELCAALDESLGRIGAIAEGRLPG
jgi:hypothetical protein